MKGESPGSAPAVRIARQVLVDLRAHAREERPHECCGLLIGNREEILEAMPARNDRPSVDRYLINPEDHFRAIRHARAAGLAVIGAYHSHPATPAVPSTTDVEEAHEVGYLYLIVSLTEHPARVAGFRFTREQFVPVDLQVV